MSYEIITFYEFKELAGLEILKSELQNAMRTFDINGTIIIATEGFNSTVCGTPENIALFIPEVERILASTLEYKKSFNQEMTFKRQKVRIKNEIVTLRKNVDIAKGAGTHVDLKTWNSLISDPDVYVLDTRNDYEYRVGTFKNAVNPRIGSFTELPKFIDANLNPKKNRKVAMFCTGGIRCEKFAPYMKGLGFEEVYQLNGGILKYLEEIDAEDSLWEGECFVFDERITVDENLESGCAADLSLEEIKSND
ncbi:MAG: rhodanese-related sulfurtransferase [Pyrinomonadaceae bacterium]